MPCFNYTCPNGHTTSIQAQDFMVIPIITECPICRELAAKGAETDNKPTHEWYVPVKRRGLTKEDNRRFRKGGVYLKQIL